MNQPDVSRARRPLPGPARDYHFPAVERFALANGLAVVVAPISRLPIATVLAVVDAGAGWDPSGREGQAQLVAKLLVEGAGKLDGAQLAEALERLGATVEASADWDAAVLSMTVTTPHLEPAFALFADMLRRPAFQKREIERLKAERRAELLQLRTEPRGLADEVFASTVYDPSSRFSVAEGGTEMSVEATESSGLTNFFAARYTPSTTTLIVAGDLSASKAMDAVTKYFADWTGTADRGNPVTDKAARMTRATHVIAKEDAPQSEIRLGHVGVPRSHSDYFDLVVMNAILGGLFNSRINMNIREAHAYAYSASSFFDWRRSAGPFVISTAVRSDATGDAIREILKEVDRMRTESVPPSELSLATSYLDGVFPIRFETTAAVAGALANQVIYGLPENYFDTYRSRIRAVTSESILRAAGAHLSPDRMQAVVVGDPNVVSSQLKELAFGPMLAGNDSSLAGRA